MSMYVHRPVPAADASPMRTTQRHQTPNRNARAVSGVVIVTEATGAVYNDDVCACDDINVCR